MFDLGMLSCGFCISTLITLIEISTISTVKKELTEDNDDSKGLTRIGVFHP